MSSIYICYHQDKCNTIALVWSGSPIRVDKLVKRVILMQDITALIRLLSRLLEWLWQCYKSAFKHLLCLITVHSTGCLSHLNIQIIAQMGPGKT